MDILKCTTEIPSEERIIIWEVKKFSELQQIKSPNNEQTTTLEFTAGKTLGQLTNWELQLHFTKKNDIGMYLSLGKSYESQKSVWAQYVASIKSKGRVSKWLLYPSLPSDIREYTTSCRAWGWKKFVTLNKLKIGGALINDTLTIKVKVVIYGEEKKETTPTCTEKMIKEKEKSLNHMSNHFKQLLQTGEHSDFVIRVKDLYSKEYIAKKVHRNILSSRSPVFEAMMGSQMREKETGVVTIEDLTPKGLNVLLEFIYTGNLHENWKLVPEEIVNAAEKYNLPLLKEYIGERLHEACTPENAFTLLSLAKNLGLPKASKNCVAYIKTNLENVLTMM